MEHDIWTVWLSWLRQDEKDIFAVYVINVHLNFNSLHTGIILKRKYILASLAWVGYIPGHVTEPAWTENQITNRKRLSDLVPTWILLSLWFSRLGTTPVAKGITVVPDSLSSALGCSSAGGHQQEPPCAARPDPMSSEEIPLLDLTPVLSVLRVILLVTLVLMCPKCHFPCLLVNNLESGRINVWIISVCAMCLNPCELLLPLCPLCIWMGKLLSSCRFINWNVG